MSSCIQRFQSRRLVPRGAVRSKSWSLDGMAPLMVTEPYGSPCAARQRSAIHNPRAGSEHRLRALSLAQSAQKNLAHRRRDTAPPWRLREQFVLARHLAMPPYLRCGLFPDAEITVDGLDGGDDVWRRGWQITEKIECAHLPDSGTMGEAGVVKCHWLTKCVHGLPEQLRCKLRRGAQRPMQMDDSQIDGDAGIVDAAM